MTHQIPPAARAAKYIFISRTIARDYEARGVFPDLRRRSVDKETSYYQCYKIFRGLAQRIFDDAMEQRSRPGQGKGGGGRKVAYLHLARQMLSFFTDDIRPMERAGVLYERPVRPPNDYEVAAVADLFQRLGIPPAEVTA